MSRTRYRIFENEYPYFLTCTVVDWLPVFTRPEIFMIIIDSWDFLQKHDRLELFGYVILENHLHLVAASTNLSKEIGDFKSFTARQILDYLAANGFQRLLKEFEIRKLRHKGDRTHQFWQEGSHPQQIRNGEMMRQKLEYAHMNPVKRGYVDEPLHWRHSSARNYAGIEGVISVTTRW